MEQLIRAKEKSVIQRKVLIEATVLATLFNYLDENPDKVNDGLTAITKIYAPKIDMVDVTNCFLDFTWADIDNQNQEEILYNFLNKLK